MYHDKETITNIIFHDRLFRADVRATLYTTARKVPLRGMKKDYRVILLVWTRKKHDKNNVTFYGIE